jgi:hypothetical protein
MIVCNRDYENSFFIMVLKKNYVKRKIPCKDIGNFKNQKKIPFK